MGWKVQKDSSLEMTVAATPPEHHIFYAIGCLFTQQEESLAGELWPDELSE